MKIFNDNGSVSDNSAQRDERVECAPTVELKTGSEVVRGSRHRP